MPMPTIYELAHKYLFEDVENMRKYGVPPVTIDHIVRLRDIYNYWMSHPSKRDRDIIEELKARGIAKSRAYVDLNIVKQLLGTFQKNTKDYIRYRFTAGILRAIEHAEAKGDLDAAIKGYNTLARYHQLDKDDDEDRLFEIAPQVFKFTDDPTVAGFKPVPNLREKIRKMKELYWTEDVKDIDFEPIEFNEDEIFNPKKSKNGGEDIS